MAQVTLENVQKVYDRKVKAVHDFSLRIDDGEFVVLVGPSGCGKSTTLRMIAGLEEITAGTVSIGDRVVNTVHPKDRDIAMVFQNYALYPHMTVFRNMAFGLALRKMPRDQIRSRVQETAQLLGIDHLLERRPKALSGGQRQRVALGRAIVREPKVFLFDEPLSNLDAKLRATTRTELKKLHARLRTTTIYVTHDQIEAMTLGDRIVVMSDGLIQQVDTPLQVYRRPANRFVGAFVGATPMNFIDGQLSRGPEGVVFDAPGARITLPHPEGAGDGLPPRASLGIRPEALHTCDDEAGAHLTATPVVIEPLGDSIDVSCELPDGLTILARVDATSDVQTGRPTHFKLDFEHVHLFEPGEFGRNLLHA